MEQSEGLIAVGIEKFPRFHEEETAVIDSGQGIVFVEALHLVEQIELAPLNDVL